MDFKIGIVEHKDFSDAAKSILSDVGKLSFFDTEKETLTDFINAKSCIFIRLKYSYCEKIITNTTELKYICTPTTGLNHVDVDFMHDNGIQVISLKGETDFLNTITATPEHTIGLALALLRNYNRAFLNKKNKIWNRELYKGLELNNTNVGIIGFGRVGNTLCKYLNAFNANVEFYDIDNGAVNRYYAKKVNSLSELINNNELIFLCASYSKKYEKFISKEFLDLMRNKFFINTSRGEFVDEEHLIHRIQENAFKGVALDVISNETGENNLNRLLSLTKENNLIITPHIAGATYQSMWNTEVFIANKLKEALSCT